MGENYINHLQIIIVPENQSYTLPSTQAEYEGKIIFLEGSHTIFVNGIKYVASSEAEYAQLNRDVTAAIAALTANHMITAITSNGVTTYTSTDKIGDVASTLKAYVDTTFIKSINTNLTPDANGNVNITGQNIEVGGSGTHSSSTVGAAIEDIYTNIGATGQNAALKLYKVVPSGTSGEQMVDGANVLLLDGSSGKEKNITADGSEYKLYQGDTVVAKFNIEKDSFVKSGSVVQGTLSGNTFTPGSGSSDTYYIHLVIGTTNDDETDLYIPATSLIDVYTGVTDSSDTGVSISVNSSNNQISASLHIKNGTDGDTVSGSAAAANDVTKTSYIQVANSVSVTTTNGTVTEATVGAGVSADAAGAANAAYNDAVTHVSNLGGSANDTVSGSAAAANNVTKTSYVQVANSAQVTTSGGQVSGVELGAGVSADAAGAANAAYTDAVSYTNTKVGQVVSWEVIGASSGS